MDKATKASASAKLLLDSGDVDGACNRAYYAMFDAARAALIWSGAPVEPTVAKETGGRINYPLSLVRRHFVDRVVGDQSNFGGPVQGLFHRQSQSGWN
jgi:hypothetical protein